LGPAISESDISSWLPTPVANDSGNSASEHLRLKNEADGGNRTSITSLAIVMTQCLLPTPTVGYSTSEPDDWMVRKLRANRGHASTVTDLLVAVRSLQGCPTAPSATTGPLYEDMAWSSVDPGPPR
jgi:hypothetical protein